MSSMRYCASCLIGSGSTSTLRSFSIPRAVRAAFVAAQQSSVHQVRTASGGHNAKRAAAPKKKKKKRKPDMWVPDIKDLPQFSLVDAMRYIRATEVGQISTSAKYELHIRLRTLKSGPVIRGQLRLPHPINTAARICVIAAPGSHAAEQAVAAGASLVGEETVFDAVKEGRIEFERCICHQDSLPKLSKANLGRILGPRGLMPSVKLGTVVKNVNAAVQNMVGGTDYRERVGVIRLGIGQLGYTPIELQTNIKTFLNKLKKDMAEISDRAAKEIHEVVLSSTHGPGLSLDGSLTGPDSPDVRDLSTLA